MRLPAGSFVWTKTTRPAAACCFVRAPEDAVWVATTPTSARIATDKIDAERCFMRSLLVAGTRLDREGNNVPATTPLKLGSEQSFEFRKESVGAPCAFDLSTCQ